MYTDLAHAPWNTTDNYMASATELMPSTLRYLSTSVWALKHTASEIKVLDDVYSININSKGCSVLGHGVGGLYMV